MPWTEHSHRGVAYMQVSVDSGRRLVRLRRSDLVISADLADAVLGSFVQDMDRIVPLAERRQYRLLTDTRDAPRAATPELEGKLLGIMAPMMMGFAAVALLLRTPIGVLQMRRILRQWPNIAEVFDDEAEATVWLLKQDSGPESRRH